MDWRPNVCKARHCEAQCRDRGDDDWNESNCYRAWYAAHAIVIYPDPALTPDAPWTHVPIRHSMHCCCRR